MPGWVAVELDSGELVAFVVAAQGAAPGEGELRNHAASQLPAAMVPRLYRFLEKIPLTPNGKVDRAVLNREMGADSHA